MACDAANLLGMTLQHRLIGGPRDGEIVNAVPLEYTIVNSESSDEPSPGHADIVLESRRFTARWRGDELVYLTVGPDYEHGELGRRADVPDDAFITAIVMDGADIDGTPGQQYEVWAVER